MKYLVQDLMLLALNNQTGSIRSSTRSALPTSLIGAVLLDLVLLNKLAIDDKLIVVDASATGNDFLDQRLNEVLTAPRARTVKFWIGHWSRRHLGFKQAVLQNLVELGVLIQQEHRSLWIFPVQRYSLTDTSIQQAIADQVRAVVLEDVSLDSRVAALISLIRACQLTNALFTSEERQIARSRIQAIAKGERVGKAVSDTIASTQAAISASMMAAITSSTASSSSNS